MLLVVFAAVDPAVAQLKIYVATDLEGHQRGLQVRRRANPTRRWTERREYFMGDLSAVVRGLRDGGATEIYVHDGHGNQAVIPHLMEPGTSTPLANPSPKWEASTSRTPVW